MPKVNSAPVPVPSADVQAEGDAKMLAQLRKMLYVGSDEGYKRVTADMIISRVAELINSQKAHNVAMATLEAAHKAALHQMEFAQSLIKRHQLTAASDKVPVPSNGGGENGDHDETDLQGQ